MLSSYAPGEPGATTSARPRSPWDAPGPGDRTEDDLERRAAECRQAALAWVFSSSTSRGPARAVLLALAGSLGADGDAVVGAAELARRAGLAPSTTFAALGELRASGEVAWMPGGGRGRANRYRLCGPGLAAVPNPPGAGGNEAPEAVPAAPNPPPGEDLAVPNPPGAGAFGPRNPPGAGASVGLGFVGEKEPPSSSSRDSQDAREPVRREVPGRKPEHPRAAELARRLAAVCRPPDHISAAMLEAAALRVAGVLLAHLDWRKADEVIGYLAGLREPPRGPVYALEVVNRWGLGRRWGVPELRLDRRAA